MIPTYNREGSIARAVRSAMRATDGRDGRDIVVVDDASTDRSAEVVRSCFGGELRRGELRLLTHARNRGVNAARNTGGAVVRNDWVIFLDSDDELIVHCDEIERVLQERGSAGVVFFRSVTDDGRLVGRALRSVEKYDARRIVRDGFPGECMAVVRRDVLAEFRFEESLRGFEGLTWATIADRHAPIPVVPLAARRYGTADANRLSTAAGLRDRACEMARGWVLWMIRFRRHLGVRGWARAGVRALFYGMVCGYNRARRTAQRGRA